MPRSALHFLLTLFLLAQDVATQSDFLVAPSRRLDPPLAGGESGDNIADTAVGESSSGSTPGEAGGESGDNTADTAARESSGGEESITNTPGAKIVFKWDVQGVDFESLSSAVKLLLADNLQLVVGHANGFTDVGSQGAVAIELKLANSLTMKQMSIIAQVDKADAVPPSADDALETVMTTPGFRQDGGIPGGTPSIPAGTQIQGEDGTWEPYTAPGGSSLQQGHEELLEDLLDFIRDIPGAEDLKDEQILGVFAILVLGCGFPMCCSKMCSGRPQKKGPVEGALLAQGYNPYLEASNEEDVNQFPRGLQHREVRFFVNALRDEYQRGQQNAVGDFLSSDVGHVIAQHPVWIEVVESMVRANPNSIDQLAEQWQL